MGEIEIPAEYTPGPWRILGGDPLRIGTNEKNPIAYVYPSNDADWEYRQARDALADEHNARLIALAPKMAAEIARQREVIAGLREALEWYEDSSAGCRKIGHAGDYYRIALDRDGGNRARAALSLATPASGSASK